MNAPTKFPTVTTISAREFNQNASRAMRAAEHGPVTITRRGSPAYVLLNNDAYERLSSRPMSAWEALVPREDIDVDLEALIPKRRVEPIRFSFDDESE